MCLVGNLLILEPPLSYIKIRLFILTKITFRSVLQLHPVHDLCEFHRESLSLCNTVSRVPTESKGNVLQETGQSGEFGISWNRRK